jgi:hypothetical protein
MVTFAKRRLHKAWAAARHPGMGERARMLAAGSVLLAPHAKPGVLRVVLLLISVELRVQKEQRETAALAKQLLGKHIHPLCVAPT